MVVADRPLLEVESNPAGSHLFLVSSKELLHTAQRRGSFLYGTQKPIGRSLNVSLAGDRRHHRPVNVQGSRAVRNRFGDERLKLGDFIRSQVRAGIGSNALRSEERRVGKEG